MVPMLVASALQMAVARAEGATAVREGGRTLTYGELDAYSSALAFALERRGVVAGDRVATLLGGIEAAVAFWAITKAGAVAIALDDADAEELAETLREIDARAFVVDAALAPTFHHAVARAPRLRAVIARGDHTEHAGSAVYVSYETALAEEDPLSRSAASRRIDLDDAWLEHDEDDVHAISHRALLSRAASLIEGLGIERTDVVGGTAFAELAVACALVGACFRISGDDVPHAPGRALWICAMDEDAPPPSGATMIELYRSASCGPIAVVTSSPNDPARVMPNVDVRIFGEDGGPAAAKVVGAIAVRSSNVEGSADGYFRTGDSGMLDDSGALYVL